MMKSFHIKYLMFTAFILAALVVTSGCSSSPMKSRLEKNLVYQCSLELLGKNVSAGEAERICSSAHKAEMEERAFSADLRAGRRVVPASRSPASNRPTPQADQNHPDDKAED